MFVVRKTCDPRVCHHRDMEMLSDDFRQPANICGTRVLNALVNARKTAIWRFGIWNILILLSLSSVLTFAQTQTQPLGIDDARISSTLYFPDAATELDTRKALHAQIQPLVDEITQSNLTSLVRVLDRAYSAIGALHRHDAYLKVKSLEDTQDQDVRRAQQAVSADQSALNAAIDRRLKQVPVDQIPALGPYAFLVSKIQRNAKHTLSPDQESYRHSVTLPHEQAMADAHDRIDQSLRSIGSKEDLSSLDLATRRTALKARNDAYNAAAPTLATLLATLIDVENRDAIAQGYADAAERKYDSLGLSGQIVDRTLDAVEAQASVYKSYEALVADHAAKKLGVPSTLSTEQDVSPGKPRPISFPQAEKLILEAFAPLGPDYTKRFSQLLDPANGRLDLTGGSHRARTGTSIGVYDGPVAFYYGGYDGSLPSVAVIAHEGGHAIHRELMNAGGIPVYERDPPIFCRKESPFSMSFCCSITRQKPPRAHRNGSTRWSVCFRLFPFNSLVPQRRRHWSATSMQKQLAMRSWTGRKSIPSIKTPFIPMNTGQWKISGHRAIGCGSRCCLTILFILSTIFMLRSLPWRFMTKPRRIRTLLPNMRHSCVAETMRTHRRCCFLSAFVLMIPTWSSR